MSKMVSVPDETWKQMERIKEEMEQANSEHEKVSPGRVIKKALKKAGMWQKKPNQ